MKQSDVEYRRMQLVLLDFAANKLTIGQTLRALRPRRSRDTERLRVGDLVVPTDHIITVRRINADGVWTGHNSDKQWWCCRSQDNLVRVRAKGRGGR